MFKVLQYSVSTKNNVISSNTAIIPDGYSCLLFKNIGLDSVFINDNIPLLPGSTFIFDNQPFVKIDENTTLYFTGANANKKVLVIKTYFKKVINYD